MMTTRRATVDDKLKEKIRQRVKELLDEKSGQTSDGEIYLFDEPVSKTARMAKIAKRVLALEFDTRNELEQYKKKFDLKPGTRVIIKQEQKSKGKKEDKPSPDSKKQEEEKDKTPGKKEEEKDKTPGKKEVEKKEETPKKDKPEEDKKTPEKDKGKEKDNKGDKEPGREVFLGPDNPHHPAQAPEGEHRRDAIKDALISEFGKDAVNWRTHKISETQLTDHVIIRFPDGSKKKYGELSDEEKGRVKNAISEGMAASKGMNDYNRVDISTMKKNMDNNLSMYDDNSIEETKNDSKDAVSAEGASEFAKKTRDNARNLVRKYRKAMSTVSEPIMEKCVDDYSDAIKHAVSDGSLSGVSQSDIDDFVREDVKRLVTQEVETKRRSLGDHGIRHVAGNVRSSVKMLDELSSHGVKLTGKQKLMAVAIQMNHDLGYTVGEAATDASKGKTHKQQSKDLAEQEKSRYEKIFGADDAQKIVDIIGTHDTNDIDWDKDPVGSTVRVADNTSLFGDDKVQDLFIRNPKTMDLACKLYLAAKAKPDDKELQKNIKKQMHDAVEEAGFDGDDADELHRQIDEMSEGKFSTTSDILSRYSGRLKGFKYNPDKKMMDVQMAYSPEGECVNALFGDKVATQQIDKLAKDMNVQPLRGNRGKMTFKNTEGKRAFRLDIEGFDKEPISSASTGAMRNFLKNTSRGELRHASGFLKRTDAGEKEIERAKKAMEPAKEKLTEAEWKDLMKAFDENKDVAELAKKLDAWPLFESEAKYLGSKQASLKRIAMTICMDFLADKIAKDLVGARGMQVNRKDKDTMQDTGGSSKTREKEPEIKPRREDVRKPFRTKNKTSPEKDSDVDSRKDKTDDKDVKASVDFVMIAKKELSRWPAKFIEAVMRLL